MAAIIADREKTIEVVYFNTRGLNHKTKQIEVGELLRSLPNTDVLAMTETKLTRRLHLNGW